MKIPNYLWGEAIRHATYIINRVATKVLINQTPYEIYKGRKPKVKHVRVFGCIGYTKTDSANTKKLDDRSRTLVHLGTEPGSKAYKLFDPISRKIVMSRDVVFDVNKGWKWSNSNDTEDNPGIFKLTFGDYGNLGISEEVDVAEADTVAEITEEDDETNSHEENDVDEVQLRRSTRNRKPLGYLEDYIYLAEIEGEHLLLLVNDKPWFFKDAMEEKVWRDACKDEIASIEKNKTWTMIDLPKGAKAIGLKWIFKIKRNSDGSINEYKSRLVAKGYIQRHGIDFEEVFAPVAHSETVRFIIALAASHGWEVHHLDVKTAFLHGDLKEDVYVTQPEGYEVKGSEHKVYKLHKALYGLKQALRAWNEKLNKILGDLGFVKCSKVPSLYLKRSEESLLMVKVYVDDLLITGSKTTMINEFKKNMSTIFEMSDLGFLTYYVGIEVRQSKEGIMLNQESYAGKILSESGMQDCNSVHVPMEFGLKLSKA